MHPLPHTYAASASASPTGSVALSSPGLPDLDTAAPAAFGGPGDRWSPETMLTAAVADCLALTFRALARARQLPWTVLEVSVDGTLDRVDGVTRFTSFDVAARLTIPPDADPQLAERLVERAEVTCLVSRSLSAPSHLRTEVIVESEVERSAA